MTRLMLFAGDSHNENGGMNDLIGIVDTVDDAKQLLLQEERKLPYGHAEWAHVYTIADPPVKIAEYLHYPHMNLVRAWDMLEVQA